MRQATIKYAPFVVILVAWEIAAYAGMLNPAFFSSPVAILDAALDWYGRGRILPHLQWTLLEILAGVTLSFVVGIPLGIVVGWSRWMSDSVSPVLFFLDAVPSIALAPTVPLVLGLGPWTAIVLVFFLTVLPLAINVAAGVHTVSGDLLRMGRHFGADDRRLLTTIVLPSVVPYIVGASRGNIGRALAGAMVGEWLGSNVGLGAMIFNAAGIFEVKGVYVGTLTVVAISLVASAALGAAEARIYRWRPA
jgi:NitT/TauT family transport system permease protein